MILADDRTCFGESRAFGLQVERQIFVGRVDAVVAEPMCDGAQVNTGSEQVHGRAVTEAVRVDAFSLEGRF